MNNHEEIRARIRALDQERAELLDKLELSRQGIEAELERLYPGDETDYPQRAAEIIEGVAFGVVECAQCDGGIQMYRVSPGDYEDAVVQNYGGCVQLYAKKGLAGYVAARTFIEKGEGA